MYTVLDIMLKVAELGLLRKNKDELNKMVDYMNARTDSTGDWYEITPHHIYLINEDDDGNEEWEDITEEVLVDIYGEDLSDY